MEARDLCQAKNEGTCRAKKEVLSYHTKIIQLAAMESTSRGPRYIRALRARWEWISGVFFAVENALLETRNS